MTAVLSIVAVGIFHPPATGGSREPIGALCTKMYFNHFKLFYSVSAFCLYIEQRPGNLAVLFVARPTTVLVRQCGA